MISDHNIRLVLIGTASILLGPTIIASHISIPYPCMVEYLMRHVGETEISRWQMGNWVPAMSYPVSVVGFYVRVEPCAELVVPHPR